MSNLFEIIKSAFLGHSVYFQDILEKIKYSKKTWRMADHFTWASFEKSLSFGAGPKDKINGRPKDKSGCVSNIKWEICLKIFVQVTIKQ